MENVSQKSRALYIVLAILLGGLGIHNFYAGRIAPAVVQLLLSIFGAFLLGVGPVIVVIWVLVEIFAVKKDGKGQPFA